MKSPNKYNIGDEVKYDYHGICETMTIKIIGYYPDEGTDSGIFYGDDAMELPEIPEEDIIDFA